MLLQGDFSPVGSFTPSLDDLPCAGAEGGAVLMGRSSCSTGCLGLVLTSRIQGFKRAWGMRARRRQIKDVKEDVRGYQKEKERKRHFA